MEPDEREETDTVTSRRDLLGGWRRKCAVPATGQSGLARYCNRRDLLTGGVTLAASIGTFEIIDELRYHKEFFTLEKDFIDPPPFRSSPDSGNLVISLKNPHDPVYNSSITSDIGMAGGDACVIQADAGSPDSLLDQIYSKMSAQLCKLRRHDPDATLGCIVLDGHNLARLDSNNKVVGPKESVFFSNNTGTVNCYSDTERSCEYYNSEVSTLDILSKIYILKLVMSPEKPVCKHVIITACDEVVFLPDQDTSRWEQAAMNLQCVVTAPYTQDYATGTGNAAYFADFLPDGTAAPSPLSNAAAYDGYYRQDPGKATEDPPMNGAWLKQAASTQQR